MDADKNSFVDQPNSLITQSRQLTFVGPRAGEGYFSADGKKMIFQSERYPGNPFYQMYLLDLTTQQTRRVSTGQGQTTCGWIHPNMNKVMWSSTHLDPKTQEKVKTEYEKRNSPIKQKYSWAFDDQYSIFSSDLDGRNIQRLTTAKGYNAEGSYSPDGRSIAFASNRKAYEKKLTPEEQKMFDRDPSYFMDIYIMDADGKNVRQLTTTAGYDGGPFFSPDGQKITWRRFSADGSKAEIYTMNIDGSEQKQITNLGSMSWAPFYHPSGDYIVFGTSVLGFANFELFIVDANGKQKPVRASFQDGFDGLASFSPDGQNLTWSHRNEKGESQIYLAKWDDQQARRLLNLPPPTIQLNHLDSAIQSKDTEQIVQYLASEKMQGRATGSPQEIEYTNKIAQLFKKWGLKPAVGQDYIQKFEFTSGMKVLADNKAELQGRFQKKMTLGQDYQILSFSKTGNFQPTPVVFAGFGIKAPATSDFAAYDSFKDLDVQGKILILLDGQPIPSNKDLKKHVHLLNYSRLQHKITVAKNLGAVGVVVVSESKVGDFKFEGSLSESSMPVLKISSQVLDSILEKQDIEKNLKSYKSLKALYDNNEMTSGFALASQYISAQIQLEVIKSTGHNVLAVLRPELKTKALLVGAHGDHLGLGQFGSSLAKGDDKNQPHYGADDNASGVAGVLELAHYQSTRVKQLTRPIVFAVWSGEEVGVLGSTYFVKSWSKEGYNRKSFTQSFAAGLNMDMIGRLREQLYIQGVGSALTNQWGEIFEKIALRLPTSLSLTTDPYLPTDSMAIYLGEIPSITYFTGAHPQYHTPQDKPETLNYQGLQQVIEVVNQTIQILQQPQTKMAYNKIESNSGKKMEGRSFRIFLGTIPDYSQEGVLGVRISGTAKNSPAEKAGLKSGDTIIEFDQTKIENIYDYVYTLQSVKPDIKTKIKVKRGEQVLELDLTPVLKE